MSALISSLIGSIAGEILVPGDKSISHRALILGALAIGKTQITSLLESDDVLATAAALRNLGVDILKSDDGTWSVFGRGVGGLSEPESVLDMGNSGTAARLLMGVMASHPFKTTFVGDKSLSMRPMERVMIPLRQMGGQFSSRSEGRLPITVNGSVTPVPISYELPVASAQVKSAILLAGLNTQGLTSVVEKEPTRDHSERMLSYFGANLSIEKSPKGENKISILGQPELTGNSIIVPGDFSSAAFIIVAALIVPSSNVKLKSIGLNPLRTGLLKTLQEMGGEIKIYNERFEGGEPVGDLEVSSSSLKGIVVPASRAPSMIDEYPILAVAAAFSLGETHLQGLGELRVKESDRLSAIAEGLSLAGVKVSEIEDSLLIKSTGKVTGGVTIKTSLDHRIAMAFLVLGMAAENPIIIDDSEMIDTSFPDFISLMNRMGASIKEISI
ncbi:MAG: 3-phosphoshikimate 1-carboxyvinyltransferase [Pseudomonadota bacterium]|nr:3-phosphoshikimate 1-carboxyvinyltransferase [Pseudomonadota bacterium]